MNTETTLNWTRKPTGKYATRYTVRRGPWAFTIYAPRDGSCTLTALRNGVVVLREETGTPAESKKAAYGMLSAAERVAWTDSRCGSPTGPSYTARYGNWSFKAVRTEDGYLVTADDGIRSWSDPDPYETLRAVKAAVADLLDRMFPPPRWEPLDPPACVCPHCAHCRGTE